MMCMSLSISFMFSATHRWIYIFYILSGCDGGVDYPNRSAKPLKVTSAYKLEITIGMSVCLWIITRRVSYFGRQPTNPPAKYQPKNRNGNLVCARVFSVSKRVQNQLMSVAIATKCEEKSQSRILLSCFLFSETTHEYHYSADIDVYFSSFFYFFFLFFSCVKRQNRQMRFNSRQTVYVLCASEWVCLYGINVEMNRYVAPSKASPIPCYSNLASSLLYTLTHRRYRRAFARICSHLYNE